jgi:hypothetical protein
VSAQVAEPGSRRTALNGSQRVREGAPEAVNLGALTKLCLALSFFSPGLPPCTARAGLPFGTAAGLAVTLDCGCRPILGRGAGRARALVRGEPPQQRPLSGFDLARSRGRTVGEARRRGLRGHRRAALMPGGAARGRHLAAATEPRHPVSRVRRSAALPVVRPSLELRIAGAGRPAILAIRIGSRKTFTTSRSRRGAPGDPPSITRWRVDAAAGRSLDSIDEDRD